MPSLSHHGFNDDIAAIAQQDYLDELIPVIKDTKYNDRTSQLSRALSHVAAQCESEIERIGSRNHTEFISSVEQLLHVRQGSEGLVSEIMGLHDSIRQSMSELVEQKLALTDSSAVRQNVEEASSALRACLDVLSRANQVHHLLGEQNYYAALRALDELRNVQLREISRYKIADLIGKSVPATQKLISEAVLADLNTWLFRIRESTPTLGGIAFYDTEMRRARLKKPIDLRKVRIHFDLNSPISNVADELDEFNVMINDELEIVFTPLLEACHMNEQLGKLEEFRKRVADNRHHQKEVMMPTSISLADDEGADLNLLLENICGFAIIERVTLRKSEKIRSLSDVEELWNSMCHIAINVISSASHSVESDEKLLKVKNMVTVFMQTVESWEYNTDCFNALLLTLFDRYSEVLQKRYSEDFQEIIFTDDYMPMSIDTLDKLDKVVSWSWYKPEVARDQMSFPCVLPFSQMYPLCCFNVWNFIQKIRDFSDKHFQHRNIVEKSLIVSLDELLCDKVCKLLLEQLSSQYLGQIVQILTNLGHFETTCEELETFLTNARTSSLAYTGKVVLRATEQFRAGKKTAEKRIFELVNSKIDALVESAEYDWLATVVAKEVSAYMQTLTRYLSSIMHSVLLGLPAEIKELIYFDALSHTGAMMLSLPMDREVKRITPSATANLARDVRFLSDFVDSLNNPILQQNLDELQQTTALMQTDNPDEFYDVAQRNRKFGRVDPQTGAILLENYRLSECSENDLRTLDWVFSNN